MMSGRRPLIVGSELNKAKKLLQKLCLRKVAVPS